MKRKAELVSEYGGGYSRTCSSGVADLDRSEEAMRTEQVVAGVPSPTEQQCSTAISDINGVKQSIIAGDRNTSLYHSNISQVNYFVNTNGMHSESSIRSSGDSIIDGFISNQKAIYSRYIHLMISVLEERFFFIQPQVKTLKEKFKVLVGYVSENHKESKVMEILNNLLPRSSLVIVGVAGSGKSTILNYCAALWGEDMMWQKFSLVHLIRLRELRRDGNYSLANLIHPLKVTDPNISKYLFLIDGYDELYDIKEFRTVFSEFLSRGSAVVVTTRPFTKSADFYAWNEKLQLHLFSDIIQIQPFTTLETTAYIEEYFRDSINWKERVARAQVIVGRNRDVISTPILLAIICYCVGLDDPNSIEYALQEDDLLHLPRIYEILSKLLVQQHIRTRDDGRFQDLLNRPSVVLEIKFLQSLCYETIAERKDRSGFYRSEFEKVKENLSYSMTFNEFSQLQLVKNTWETETKDDRYVEFIHSTFVEFFAAGFIASRCVSQSLTNGEFIRSLQYDLEDRTFMNFIIGSINGNEVGIRYFLDIMRDNEMHHEYLVYPHVVKAAERLSIDENSPEYLEGVHQMRRLHLKLPIYSRSTMIDACKRGFLNQEQRTRIHIFGPGIRDDNYSSCIAMTAARDSEECAVTLAGGLLQFLNNVDKFANLKLLHFHRLGDFDKLPSLAALVHLQAVDLRSCSALTSVGPLPNSLRELRFEICEKLQEVSSMQHLTQLMLLCLYRTTNFNCEFPTSMGIILYSKGSERLVKGVMGSPSKIERCYYLPDIPHFQLCNRLDLRDHSEVKLCDVYLATTIFVSSSLLGSGPNWVLSDLVLRYAEHKHLLSRNRTPGMDLLCNQIVVGDLSLNDLLITRFSVRSDEYLRPKFEHYPTLERHWLPIRVLCNSTVSPGVKVHMNRCYLARNLCYVDTDKALDLSLVKSTFLDQLEDADRWSCQNMKVSESEARILVENANVRRVGAIFIGNKEFLENFQDLGDRCLFIEEFDNSKIQKVESSMEALEKIIGLSSLRHKT